MTPENRQICRIAAGAASAPQSLSKKTASQRSFSFYIVQILSAGLAQLQGPSGVGLQFGLCIKQPDGHRPRLGLLAKAVDMHHFCLFIKDKVADRHWPCSLPAAISATCYIRYYSITFYFINQEKYLLGWSASLLRFFYTAPGCHLSPIQLTHLSQI